MRVSSDHGAGVVFAPHQPAEPQIDGFRRDDAERVDQPRARQHVGLLCAVEFFERGGELARRAAVVFAADIDPTQELQQACAVHVARSRERGFDDLFGFRQAVRRPSAQRAVVRDLRDERRCASLRERRGLVEQLFALLPAAGACQCSAVQHLREDGLFRALHLFARALQQCHDLILPVECQQRACLQHRRADTILAAVELRCAEQLDDALVLAGVPGGICLAQLGGT